ncbi:hypothetical protein DDV21_011175 [Streptococcus chenjunshii]|uniref:Uncharacterized protein n=1 Tax=Streptococcus chenjunshii TaxID=2173853 RepID=A0A372KML1_9STRE|nr:hypothetical protein DDV21_011175 [Streptococcus chenjunshii]RFU51497.1 hypothetical protein DDV22_03230 [Streptococcus chenjunshii]RFU53522.1 hypothetical protein DDV23_04010 [Streptococcus chenjunshii]
MFNSTRHKGREKSKAKIGGWAKNRKVLGQTVFFAQLLGRVQFNKTQRPLKIRMKDGKSEIFDFADAPLPGRLERGGC